jgi:hypothetical protein
MRSIAETRSSSRLSTGRGTEVDSETVVDSNAASAPFGWFPADFLRISDPNMLSERLSPAQFAPKWDFMDTVVKRAFLGVESSVVAAYPAQGEDIECRSRACC